MDFSEKLKKVMEIRNVTQVELAKQCDVKQPTVAEWLSGRCKPSLDTFKKICNVLKVDARYLLSIRWTYSPDKKYLYEIPNVTD